MQTPTTTVRNGRANVGREWTILAGEDALWCVSEDSVEEVILYPSVHFFRDVRAKFK